MSPAVPEPMSVNDVDFFDPAVIYARDGWVPATTLADRDDPDHSEMRNLFDHAFRPKRLNALESQIEHLADELIDEMWFLDDTELSIAPNYFLRALRELKTGSRPAD